MGICTECDPDDDELVQLMLLVDQVHQKLAGINCHHSMRLQSNDDNVNVQSLCAKLGQLILDIFKKMVFVFGMNGLMKTEILVLFTATSGATGIVRESIRYKM